MINTNDKYIPVFFDLSFAKLNYYLNIKNILHLKIKRIVILSLKKTQIFSTWENMQVQAVL